jgi:hypothetical protein
MDQVLGTHRLKRADPAALKDHGHHTEMPAGPTGYTAQSP